MRRGFALLAAAAVVSSIVVACSAGPHGENVGEISEANTSVCPTMVVEGVDVYDGQGAIDWMKVAAAGKDFAIIKATQGNYNKQSTFSANWAGSKAAGILRSPYHFFDPTIDGVTQANWFLAEVNAAGGLAPGDLPPMLDIECPTSGSQGSASPNCEYTGNSGWAPSATITQRVFDWLNTVEQATGKKAIIYSYPAWFADVGLTDARLANYPLFIATLASCASVPPPWTTTMFWQYSFTGTVSGIPGQVDLDRFVGTKAQLGGVANGPDGGAPDASALDGAAHDAAADAHAPDGGSHDTGAHDAEAGSDAGGGIHVAHVAAAAGCSCRTADWQDTSGAGVAAVALGLLALLRVTRRAREPG